MADDIAGAFAEINLLKRDLSHIDTRTSSHEAVCAERYANLNKTLGDVMTRLGDLSERMETLVRERDQRRVYERFGRVAFDAVKMLAVGAAGAWLSGLFKGHP